MHASSRNDDGTLTDDGGTGFATVTPLIKKSDVIMALQSVCTNPAVMNGPPSRIHSDNAKEFTSQVAELWYQRNGIHHTVTEPYGHHQIGKVERLQGQLKSMARALMLHAGTPPEYWDFALQQACLIRNMIYPPPNKTASTIWEAHYGIKPDVSILQPFGCLAYICMTREQQGARGISHSFGPRALTGVYLGLNNIHGASKHVVMSDAKLLCTTSQNIIFNPTIYPYRPAATIPQHIAHHAIRMTKFEPATLDHPHTDRDLSALDYLTLFVTTRQALPATRSSKTKPDLAKDINRHLDPTHSNEKYYEVDEILAHRGTGKKLEFLVRWTGYDSKHDSWVPINDCNKALIQEYYDKHQEETPLIPNTADLTPQRPLPKDPINGDYTTIDAFKEIPAPRQSQPIKYTDPADFNLPPLPSLFKEAIPYKDAPYTCLTPRTTTQARQANLTHLIGQQTRYSFDTLNTDPGTIEAYDIHTNTWRIKYLDDTYEIVDPETLSTMLITPSNLTPEEERHHLLSHLIHQATPHTYTTMKTPPKGPKQAQLHPDAPLLQKAVKEEIDAFFRWGVFTEKKISDLPPNTTLLPSHVVYKDKTKINPATGKEEFDHWRARLVIGGHKQKDFTDTFAPTPSWPTIRLIINFTSTAEWEVCSHDLEKAFVRTPLTGRAIYVRPPPGLAPPGICWLLHFSVYGLKDSNAEFNRLFVKTVLSFEGLYENKPVKFQQCPSDPCLFVLYDHNNQPLIILTSYIDDLILAFRHKPIYNAFLAHIKTIWNITDSDTLNKYLGIHFKRLPHGGWQFDASAYIERAVAKYLRYPISAHKTPLPTNYAVVIPPDHKTTPEQLKHFQSILGTLLYCALAVRFDIIHSISLLAQYTVNPTEELIKMAYRVLGYLSGTKDLAIKYELPTSPQERHILSAYCDAGYAGCPQTRRSQEGYIVFLNGSPIFWKSSRQPWVTLSTCEAEMCALVNAAKQVLFLSKLLTYLAQPQHRIIIYEDNTSTISISEQTASPTSSRTKHMDTRLHWLKEQIQEGILKPMYIPTHLNVADIFTKCLSPDIFSRLVKLILSSRSNPALISQDQP